MNILGYVMVIYLIYMMCFFQTHNNFSLDFQNFGGALKHSTDYNYNNKICLLGKVVSLILSVLILWKVFGVKYITLGVFIVGLMMNLNFALYLLPVLIILWIMY